MAYLEDALGHSICQSPTSCATSSWLHTCTQAWYATHAYTSHPYIHTHSCTHIQNTCIHQKKTRYLLDPPPAGPAVGVDPCDYNYVTPLMMAAERGCTGAVDLLIDGWGNIVQRNRGGITPLMVASKYGHAEVVKLLLHAGSIVSACDDQQIRMLSVRRPTETYRVVNRGPAPKGPIYCMDIWQDQIVTGHMDGVVKLTSLTTQQERPYALAGFEEVCLAKRCWCDAANMYVCLYACICVYVLFTYVYIYIYLCIDTTQQEKPYALAGFEEVCLEKRCWCDAANMYVCLYACICVYVLFTYIYIYIYIYIYRYY
jgi:hypothetical protein